LPEIRRCDSRAQRVEACGIVREAVKMNHEALPLQAWTCAASDSRRFPTDAMNTNIVAGLLKLPQRQPFRIAADRCAPRGCRGRPIARSSGQSAFEPMVRLGLPLTLVTPATGRGASVM
jgi:hypothetical protein